MAGTFPLPLMALTLVISSSHVCAHAEDAEFEQGTTLLQVDLNISSRESSRLVLNVDDVGANDKEKVTDQESEQKAGNEKKDNVEEKADDEETKEVDADEIEEVGNEKAIHLVLKVGGDENADDTEKVNEQKAKQEVLNEESVNVEEKANEETKEVGDEKSEKVGDEEVADDMEEIAVWDADIKNRPLSEGAIANVNSTNNAQREIEFKRKQPEVEVSLKDPDKVHVVSKVTLAIISALGLGCCGVDRCFLGSVCCGVCKGLTLGGFGVWAFIDYVIILINCMRKKDEISTFGLNAQFITENDEIQTAFIIAMAGFFFSLLSGACKVQGSSPQSSPQPF